MTVRRLLLAAALAASFPAFADPEADRIRACEQAFAKHIVWLKMAVTDEEGQQHAGACSGVLFRRGGRVVMVSPIADGVAGTLRMLKADGKEVEAEVLGRDEAMGYMFVSPKDAKDDEGFSALDAPKGKVLELGDPLVLIDRRSHGAPEETTCRMTRVTCVLTEPRRCYFYRGLLPFQVGGFAVTPDGEAVGMVGGFVMTDAEGGEARGVALLPLEQILESLTTLKPKE